MHLSKLSEEQFRKLSFIEDSFPLFRGTKDNRQIIHELSKENYAKIKKIFEKNDPLDLIKPGSKVFMLPHCTFKQSVIKEVCKKKNLRVVTDVSKADVIVTNSNFEETGQYGEAHLQNTYMFYTMYYSKYDTINYSVSRLEKFCNDSRIQLACEDYLEDIKNLQIDSVCFNMSQQGSKKGFLTLWDYDHNCQSNSYVITDDCANTLYYILKNSLVIVSDKSLFNSIEKVVIDKDYYDTIAMMIQGSREDKNLAMEILYNCDINKSFYYLLKLKDKHYWEVRNHKGKNTKFHKAFMAETSCDFNDHLTLLKELKERGSLNAEMYDEILEKYLKDKLSGINDDKKNKLFHVTITKLTYGEYMTLNNTSN